MLAAAKLSQEALAFKGLNHEALENTVLSTIINAKVADLPKIRQTRQELQHQLEQGFEQGLEQNLKPNQASMGFAQSLAQPGRRFILECKRASPSLGDINLSLDIKTQVGLYESRAAAISVLTEEHFFKGSYEVLSEVRALTKLPVLCKDFVICEEQIEIAAALGANAVLLMLSVLEYERFLELYHFAHSLGLDVLAEISNSSEAQFASSHNLEVVGINHRNLKTLEIDLQRSHELAPYFKDSKSIIVCESGIKDHATIESLAPQRCFLIGSALCAPQTSKSAAPALATASADDLHQAMARHMDKVLYGCNKVCGNNTAQGIEAAIRNHVALSGLIFVKKSPRYISPEQAALLIAPYRGAIKFCGVFLDQPVSEVAAIVKQLDLEVVQLHGAEDCAYIQELKNLCPNLQVIKAFNLSPEKVQSAQYLELMQQAQNSADMLLLDSSYPGSGQRCDLTLVPDFVERSRTLLAGGLGPNNLKQVLTELRSLNTSNSDSKSSSSNSYRSFSPFFAGFDLNSGLESTPGVKEAALVDAAFSQLA